MYNKQKGVGLTEVLVALVLLAIAVLGFTAMQIRAVTASIESANNTQAITIARDLAERMRINRAGWNTYRNPTESSVNCNTVACTPTQIAAFDYAEVTRKVEDAAMSLATVQCPNANLNRLCIIVSWEDTTPTIGDNDTHCVKSNATYNNGAKCVMLETYNNG